MNGAMKSPSSSVTEQILGCLNVVEAERRARQADRELLERVVVVKRYQQLRFQITYADLLASSRYGRAAEFFLTHLYGPGEFEERDLQFARITPKLVVMLPSEVVSTVADLARLHAMTEVQDSAMARALDAPRLGPLQYIKAWQQVGDRERRTEQIDLVLGIGAALDRFTRHAWLIATLRVMRGPAHAAGFAAIQGFLESGLSSFRAMRGATEFLATIKLREFELATALFDNMALDRVAQTTGNRSSVLLRHLPDGA